MTGLWRNTVTVAFALMVLGGLARAQPSDLRAMMEETGMAEQLAAMEGLMRSGMVDSMSAQQGMPPEYAEAFVEIAAEAFAGDRLIDDVEASLGATLSPEEVAAMRTFYATPLGQEVRRLEARLSTAEGAQEMEAQAAELRDELQRNPELAAIVETMNDDLHMSDISSGLVLTMMDAIFVGGLRRSNPRITPEEIEAVSGPMEAVRPMMAAQLREFGLLSLVYSYRSLTPDQLSEYGRFLSTGETANTYAAFFAALDEIFRERGEEIGIAFAEFVRQKAI